MPKWKHTKRNETNSVITDTTSYVVVSLMLILGGVFYALWEQPTYFDYNRLPEELRDTVQLLARTNHLVDIAVGIGAKRTERYERQRFILKHAGIEDIDVLTTHPRPAIKALAYEALLRRRSGERYQVLMRAFQDDDLMFFQSGCTSGGYLIGEHLMANVLHLTPNGPPPPGGREVYGFRPEEIEELFRHFERCRTLKEIMLRR